MRCSDAMKSSYAGIIRFRLKGLSKLISANGTPDFYLYSLII